MPVFRFCQTCLPPYNGQNVDMNEYPRLLAEAAAYGIDIGKLPVLLPH
jgi:hypothetical protein